MPDALNYSIGPHPGCPFKCLTQVYRVGPQPGVPLYVPDVPSNREGPQAREPCKCLNGRSYGERLAKEAF